MVAQFEDVPFRGREAGPYDNISHPFFDSMANHLATESEKGIKKRRHPPFNGVPYDISYVVAIISVVRPQY